MPFHWLQQVPEAVLRIKCKNIFTKMLKDVGIEVPKSIETRSKCSMHADKGGDDSIYDTSSLSH